MDKAPEKFNLTRFFEKNFSLDLNKNMQRELESWDISVEKIISNL